MAHFKRLLNSKEALTDQRLQAVSERYGARVFAKVRIADVLPIEQSGIRNELFRFALQAHFDFVITGEDLAPLFAVEFDGPLHDGGEQAARDDKKNELCDRFELPLLRITSTYLDARYRSLDLLTWIVEKWFVERWIAQAQESGQLPEDDYFDPKLIPYLPGRENRFPLWLSVEPLLEIRKFHDEGRCKDRVPSIVTVVENEKTYCSFAFLRLNEREGVAVKTAMRVQGFTSFESDMLTEITPFEIAEKLKDVIAGRKISTPLEQIRAEATAFQRGNVVLSMSASGALEDGS